jgi:cob(I)alamin adenosyltransferase
VRIDDPDIRAILAIVQNDLFDLGADLCVPERGETGKSRLRMSAKQVETLEQQIDRFNEALSPLTSFILPGGSAGSAHLHLARTIVRRAECDVVELAANETVNEDALKYVNRLSDLLFVLCRHLNARGTADVLWTPGANR